MYLFFFQAEDGIRDLTVTGVQTCALPISLWLRQLQLHRYSDRRHRRACTGAAQPTRKIRHPRHARRYHGKLDVGFHRGDSFVSAKKSSRTKTPRKASPRTSLVPTGARGVADGEFERAGNAADFIFSQTSPASDCARSWFRAWRIRRRVCRHHENSIRKDSALSPIDRYW